jgi:hypothetical protein
MTKTSGFSVMQLKKLSNTNYCILLLIAEYITYSTLIYLSWERWLYKDNFSLPHHRNLQVFSAVYMLHM